MPEFVRRSGIVGLTLLASSLFANASTSPEAPPVAASAAASAASAPDEPISNSAMDGSLFFQVLVGELELGANQVGAAYQVLLDAARRTHDDGLYQQVVAIALKARAGDEALTAARDWREDHPESVEANKSVVRLMAALNKLDDIVPPLRALIALTPDDQRVGLLASLPVLFQRSPEPQKVLSTLEPFLGEQANRPGLHDVAVYVEARLAMAAGDKDKALAHLRELAASSPNNGDVVQMALELMATAPEAEAIVTQRLAAEPANATLRLAYARALAREQRQADATREFRTVTQTSPEVAPAWLALGALELEQHDYAESRKALQQYLKLVPETQGQSPDAGLESVVGAANASREQAMLMLAQADEEEGNLSGAGDWLAKIQHPSNPVELNYRRASLLARQGHMADGVKLLEALPEDTDEAARSKLLALAQFKREAGDFQGAYDSLKAAEARFPNDPDLIYERAMLADRLGHVDEMEKLLKQVIAQKPDYYNAYNALGYSLAERNTRLDEARTLVKKALELAPNQPALVDSLGWVEYRAGHLPEALDLLRKAYAAFPDAEVAAHLGEVLWQSGKTDEARRVWTEAEHRDPSNAALKDTLARFKVKL